VGLIPRLKSTIEELPPCVGRSLARLPYGWRPGFGKVYRERIAEISMVAEMAVEQKREFALKRVRSIVEYAFARVPFYQDLYQKEGLDPRDIQCFEDIQRIPVVTKTILNAWNLERRSSAAPGRYLVNTGGSSGSTLAMYIMPNSIGHEWAHMHRIWAKLGYRQSDLKFAFGGRDVGSAPLQYDSLRHHFWVNIYRPNAEIAQAMKAVLRKHIVPYVHGYPCAIYDFACYCESEDSELVAMLKQQLRGGMFGSEFPAPIYRDKIESVLGVETVSWYGQTERVVLAWEEREKFAYSPFLSYGFAETGQDGTTGKTKLFATSYYNTASPFIRYDTGDEVSPITQNDGILEEFRVEAGREGDYVIDRNRKKISLTGLVFGRHHEMFDHARFVQVAQDQPGHVTIYVSIDRDRLSQVTV